VRFHVSRGMVSMKPASVSPGCFNKGIIYGLKQNTKGTGMNVIIRIT
jgi:hypothetical protein